MPFNEQGEWVDDEEEAQRLRDEARGGADPSSGYLSGDPANGYQWNPYGGPPEPAGDSGGDEGPEPSAPAEDTVDPWAEYHQQLRDAYFPPEPEAPSAAPEPAAPEPDAGPEPPAPIDPNSEAWRDQIRGGADPNSGYISNGVFIPFSQGPNVGIPYEQQTDAQRAATNAYEIANAGPSEVLPNGPNTSGQTPSGQQPAANGPRITRVTPDGKAVQFYSEADAALFDQQLAKYAEDQKAIREWNQGLEMQKFDLSRMVAEAQIAYNNALIAGKDREMALLEAKQAQDAEYRRQDLELRRLIASQTVSLEREKMDIQRRSLRRGGRVVSVRYR